jgi:hypothetical protein
MSIREPNIDRLLAAFALKKHDRVPNLEMTIKAPTLQYVMGRKPEIDGFWEPHSPAELVTLTKETGKRPDMARSPAMKIADQVELCQKTGMDAILLRRNYVGTSKRLDFGWLRGWEDLERMDEPPPASKAIAQAKECLDLVRGTNIGVAWMLDVLLTAVYDAMGLDNFSLKLYDDPKLVIHLLDHFTTASRDLTEALSALPLAFCLFQDDLAGNHGPFVSPAWLEEHWVPRVNQILAPLRVKNIPMIFHCCGNLERILPMAIRMGFKAINPIQPTCNDIYQIKKQYGDEICLIGNMDIAGCLAYGSVDDAVRDTKEHIDRLSANGGYVVSSSHSITEAVRPENYLAMIETAHTYGRYGGERPSKDNT